MNPLKLYPEFQKTIRSSPPNLLKYFNFIFQIQVQKQQNTVDFFKNSFRIFLSCAYLSRFPYWLFKWLFLATSFSGYNQLLCKWFLPCLVSYKDISLLFIFIFQEGKYPAGCSPSWFGTLWSQTGHQNRFDSFGRHEWFQKYLRLPIWYIW